MKSIFFIFFASFCLQASAQLISPNPGESKKYVDPAESCLKVTPHSSQFAGYTNVVLTNTCNHPIFVGIHSPNTEDIAGANIGKHSKGEYGGGRHIGANGGNYGVSWKNPGKATYAVCKAGSTTEKPYDETTFYKNKKNEVAVYGIDGNINNPLYKCWMSY
jgi:hypothetical protein